MTRATSVQAWTEEVADGAYEHYVALCDDDCEPIRNSRHACDSPDDASNFANALGHQLGLEVIEDDLMR